LRLLVSAIVPAAIAATIVRLAAVAFQDSTFRLDINLTQIPALVVDAAGQPVHGLAKDNFQLFVDGNSQPITLFSDEDARIAAGIVVDNSASMTTKASEVRAAALAFARESNRQDELFVVHFSSGARLGLPVGQQFTSDISELEAALGTFRPEGTTALYDALLLAASQLRKAQLDRKILLVISDGGDNASRGSLEDALYACQRGGVVVYCVGIYNPADLDPNLSVLTKLSDITGGKAFFPAAISEITNTCVRIADDIRQQYTLGFHGAEDGKYHRIEIVASSPELIRLKVKASTGYYAPQP
jgi:VWFA-related protein